MRVRLLSASPDRPLLRALLLIVVVAATAAAFWWHFERRMAQLKPPPTAEVFLLDTDKLLSVEEARALHTWRAAFRDSLGMPVLVLLGPTNVAVPPFATGTLFVGVGLAGPEAVVVLPPLARKALGEGPRLTAEEELTACLRVHPPALCLEKTLTTLWRQLGGE